MIRSNKGFALVEFMIILFIVGAIATGFWLYRTSSAENKTETSSPTPAPITTPNLTIASSQIDESLINRCTKTEECIVVPYTSCCGSTKRAINKEFLDEYQSTPAWQSFNRPEVCNVIGRCRDDSMVTESICVLEQGKNGRCELKY